MNLRLSFGTREMHGHQIVSVPLIAALGQIQNQLPKQTAEPRQPRLSRQCNRALGDIPSIVQDIYLQNIEVASCQSLGPNWRN